MLCFCHPCHFNTKDKKGNIPKPLSFLGITQKRPCCTFSMAASLKSLYRQQQINYNHGFSKSPWQDILIVVETACTEMIGRKSAPFPHKSLLVGLLQLKTSAAALTEPCRVRRGPERDFAGCNVICGKGSGDWKKKEGEGETSLDSGFIQLTSVLDALLKRDHENLSRERNETPGKKKRDHSINDIYPDTYLRQHYFDVPLYWEMEWKTASISRALSFPCS